MTEFQEVEYEGKQLKLYQSLKAHKLTAKETGAEAESQDEYNLRKIAMREYNKQAKKQKNWKHVSKVLIPLQVDGKPVVINGQTIYNAASKGVTYRKMDGEHATLVDHFKTLADEANNEQTGK